MLKQYILLFSSLPLHLDEEKICHTKSIFDDNRIVRDTVSITAFV
ncbi:hypothetical protein J2X31_002678 [Flavobacterium arsenatis]|uniref:Uncharacterized protein n=1 Tax=Flavobacterium arsenatis TaxID=1484332 RepID=A0ABU1TS41_9FLAO|nr:hypothetical protein [Flavobacterium arsenatis]